MSALGNGDYKSRIAARVGVCVGCVDGLIADVVRNSHPSNRISPSLAYQDPDEMADEITDYLDSMIDPENPGHAL